MTKIDKNMRDKGPNYIFHLSCKNEEFVGGAVIMGLESMFLQCVRSCIRYV